MTRSGWKVGWRDWVFSLHTYPSTSLFLLICHCQRRSAWVHESGCGIFFAFIPFSLSILLIAIIKMVMLFLSTFFIFFSLKKWLEFATLPPCNLQVIKNTQILYWQGSTRKKSEIMSDDSLTSSGTLSHATRASRAIPPPCAHHPISPRHVSRLRFLPWYHVVGVGTIVVFLSSEAKTSWSSR